MKFLDAGVTVFFQEKGSISCPKQKKPLETLDFQRHYAMMLRKVRDSNHSTLPKRYSAIYVILYLTLVSKMNTFLFNAKIKRFFKVRIYKPKKLFS